MLPGGEFGHDAAVFGVKADLGETILESTRPSRMTAALVSSQEVSMASRVTGFTNYDLRFTTARGKLGAGGS